MANMNMSDWQCTAQVPDAKGNKRVTCGVKNLGIDARCRECGAPRKNATTTTTTQSNKEKTMATSNVKPANDKKNTVPTAPTPDAPKAPAAASAPAAATPSTASGDAAAAPTAAPTKPKKQRLKYVSTTDAAYYVRIKPEAAAKGAPRDFNGVEMVLSTASNAPSKKVQKIERKEQEEKLLAGMTDEQKLEYATKKRLERKAEKEAKAAQKKQNMMAELLKELEAKGKKVVDAVPSA